MRIAPVLIVLFATSTAPAPAADYPGLAVPEDGAWEVRKYVMDTGRAYGAPVREYIRITPAPPSGRIVVHGPRGTAEVIIDDRPSINSPVYIPILD